MRKTKAGYVMAITMCTIIFVLLIGFISISTTVDIIEKNSLDKLNLKAVNTCLQFDSNLESVEQCVNTLCSAAINHLDDFEKFKTDSEYVEEHTNSLRDLILNSAENTKGALTVYMRYNPEFTPPTSGLFYVKDETTGEFVDYPVTDFSKYSGNDTIWYDVPTANGEATWMMPYLNNYIDYGMISYVVPFYVDGEIAGVIGMDIDYNYIEEFVNSIKVYENGYAFLTDGNGKVIVHKDYKLYDELASEDILKEHKIALSDDAGLYKYSGLENTIVYSTTKNRMTLCVSAPNDEIYKESRDLTKRIIILEIITLIVIIFVSSTVIKKLFNLSEIDELTRIYNRKYFISAYQNIKKDDLKNYSLFIFDIDHFKRINDTYGHNAGDEAIKDTANTAKNILGNKCTLARWGGDEFIGLIPNNVVEEYLNDLLLSISSAHSTVYGNITLSIGAAHADGNTSFSDLCEKADKALYNSKKNGRNQVTIL